MIGIYSIVCITTNKLYIGSTVDLKKRFRQHLNQLRKNQHYNSYLQRSWNKYGEDMFTFNVLEHCNKDILISRENYYLQQYDKNRLFNCRIINASNNLGVVNKHRKLTENDISVIINLINSGNGLKMISRKFNISPTLIKLLLNKVTYQDLNIIDVNYNNKTNYRLTDSDVINIVASLNNNVSCKAIAKKYNVDKTTIQMIKRGLTWKKYSKNIDPTIKSKKSNERKIAIFNNNRELISVVTSLIEASTYTGVNYNTINTCARRNSCYNNSYYFQKI